MEASPQRGIDFSSQSKWTMRNESIETGNKIDATVSIRTFNWNGTNAYLHSTYALFRCTSQLLVLSLYLLRTHSHRIQWTSEWTLRMFIQRKIKGKKCHTNKECPFSLSLFSAQNTRVQSVRCLRRQRWIFPETKHEQRIPFPQKNKLFTFSLTICALTLCNAR